MAAIHLPQKSDFGAGTDLVPYMYRKLISANKQDKMIAFAYCSVFNLEIQPQGALQLIFLTGNWEIPTSHDK